MTARGFSGLVFCALGLRWAARRLHISRLRVNTVYPNPNQLGRQNIVEKTAGSKSATCIASLAKQNDERPNGPRMSRWRPQEAQPEDPHTDS